MLIRRLSAKYGRQLSLRTVSVLSSSPSELGLDTQTLKFDRRSWYKASISKGRYTGDTGGLHNIILAKRYASSSSSTPPIIRSDGLVAKLQKEWCWDGYVSTGRGCHTLFELLDTDSNNKISWQEIRFFLENVRANINPNARKEALEAASDHDIKYSEFQEWLIKATKVDPDR